MQDTKERMGRVLLEYETLLTAVSLFRYLEQTLFSTKNNWPEVEWNLRRAKEKWGQLAKILRREGADKRTAGNFYVAVVQEVLLFGSETWYLTPPPRLPASP